MLKKLLARLGYKVVYVCDWGVYGSRYDAIDRTMERPVHEDMSTAPPWAKRKIVRIETPTKG